MAAGESDRARNPVEKEAVVSSIAYALGFKGPKAARVRDERARQAMATAIAEHLSLCGIELVRCERPVTMGHLLRGPEDSPPISDDKQKSSATRTRPPGG